MPDDIAADLQGTPSEGNPSPDDAKLRKELAHSRDMNRESQKYVDFVNRMSTLPGGREIIDGLMKGEIQDLSNVSPPKGSKAEATAASGAGLTIEDYRRVVQEENAKSEERAYHARQAEKERDVVYARAKKELAGFEEIAGTPQWTESLNVVINLMQAKQLFPPDGEDPMWFATQRTYQALTGLKPGEKGKNTKLVERTEEERQEVIAGQQTTSAGIPVDSQNEALKNNKDYGWATARGKRSLGISFADYQNFDPNR